MWLLRLQRALLRLVPDEELFVHQRAAVRVIGMDPDPFMNQSLQRRRFAWLLGTVTPEREVKVAAFYEPPQLGFTDHFLLHKDPNASLVRRVHRMCVYVCVFMPSPLLVCLSRSMKSARPLD